MYSLQIRIKYLFKKKLSNNTVVFQFHSCVGPTVFTWILFLSPCFPNLPRLLWLVEPDFPRLLMDPRFPRLLFEPLSFEVKMLVPHDAVSTDPLLLVPHDAVSTDPLLLLPHDAVSTDPLLIFDGFLKIVRWPIDPRFRSLLGPRTVVEVTIVIL